MHASIKGASCKAFVGLYKTTTTTKISKCHKIASFFLSTMSHAVASKQTEGQQKYTLPCSAAADQINGILVGSLIWAWLSDTWPTLVTYWPSGAHGAEGASAHHSPITLSSSSLITTAPFSGSLSKTPNNVCTCAGQVQTPRLAAAAAAAGK